MSLNILFIVSIAIVFYLYLFIGFKSLTAENRQILAVVPTQKKDDGTWEGINFTYYGLLMANSLAVALAVFFILMGSIGIPIINSLVFMFIMLMVSLPASKIIARVVEKKQYTFTTGGASFFGFLITPLVIYLYNLLSERYHMDYIGVLTCISIAYCIGEGLGRLSCISFGCCYGKPLKASPTILQNIFKRFNFTFLGSTKKIAYEGGLEGVSVIPIQGVTALVYVTGGLLAILMFTAGQLLLAFLFAILLVYGWRLISEFLRADYRGEGKFSAYQKLSILAMGFAVLYAIFLPTTIVDINVDIVVGVRYLKYNLVILFIGITWLTIFLYFGKSNVTGATVRLFIK
ncbi:MAG: prolipoprotein diacylglyceryl transferase [Candidatus Magnetoovum sp. WYHC-5]|nr:prolipoprotein diacylglyceryl transferase [Candidatus Magnetoovum sp. WYHC-5]